MNKPWVLAPVCPICGNTSFSKSKYFEDNQCLICDDCDTGIRWPRRDMHEQEKFYTNSYHKESFHDRRSLLYKIDFGRFAPATPGRLLDFGCGMGHFLAYATKLGWETCGVDLSTRDVSKAQEILGVNAACGSIEQAEQFGIRFDCITMWNVLDHIGEPMSVLSRLHALLTPGGVLIIRVLNRKSRMLLYEMATFLQLKRIRHLLGIYHELFFSARSLTRALHESEFSRVAVRNSFPVADMGKSVNTSPVFLSILHAVFEMIYLFSFRTVRVSPSLVVKAEQ